MKISSAGIVSVALLYLGLQAVPLHGQDNVLISEFMAVNASTLADSTGAYSDWIELYNAGSNSVNLDGWFLTDNAAKLTKWRFPATNLPPSGFLVVFAAGISQTNPAIPLSTNFKLGSGGEYLALVKPDGVTVAWAYSPTYPAQFTDVSYGLAMDVAETSFVPSYATGQFLVPTGELDPGWTLPGYDDSAWLSGTTGFGYDSSGAYFGMIFTDVGGAMQGINPSAYLRLPFTVADPGVLSNLRMRLVYNDGFVAYLNGQEVARRNAPTPLLWNSAATAPHGLAVPAVPTAQDFDNPGTPYSLQTFSGSFTPSILAADAGSTGAFLRLANTSASVLNTVVFNRTATGLFSTVVATFDFRMINGSRADGMGFAFLPTSVYGASGPATGPFGGFGEEPNLAGAIGVGFDIYQNGGELNNNHVSIHYNGSLLSVPVAVPSFDLANGNFHRAQITINFDGGNPRVTVQITPNIKVGAGPTETLFADFPLPGVTPYEGRVAFGARTGGANANQDLDNVNVQFLPHSNLDFEDFDLTPFLGELLPGDNMLAIQGLNVSADDGDFLILPELIGTETAVLTNSLNYFATPTPGGPNAAGAPGFTSPPQISPAGGLFTNSVVVALALGSPSAEIHYTLDGSVPTSLSPLYSGPFTLSGGSTMVRARAFGPKLFPSDIVSQTYTIVGGDLVGFSSNLPLIIINTFGTAVGLHTKVPATMTFIDTSQGRASVLSPPDVQVRAGIEIRGQSSTSFPKNQYGFETDDENDNGLNVPLLGMPADNDWVLDAHYDDKTFMNSFMAYELHEKMGHYAVRRRFVEVFLNTTGGTLSYAQHYLGIYDLLEKIKVAPNRVDIAKLKPSDNTEPDISGGYMVKRDKTSAGDVLFTTSSGQTLIYDDPKGEDLTIAQQNWIINYLNLFEQALYAPNWLTATGTNHYSNYIDVDSFVDMHWIVEFTKNVDGYRLSDYMHKDRGGKLTIGPIWDWDLSFGNANYLEGDNPGTWYYPLLGDSDHIWLRQLVGLPSGTPPGDPNFQQKIVDRWGVLRTNVLAGSNVLARIDQIAALLNEAQARDFARWPRLGVYVWPNPDSYWPITTYQGTVDWMKTWVSNRFAWIETQYPFLAPSFNHADGAVASGFYLSITATNPIYFALNGTDPRVSGGGIAPGARLYSTPILVTNNVRVIARARTSTGQWSPPAAVTLATQTPPLVITEIMYHPSDPPAGSPFQAHDFEFIELKNTGATSLSLSNASLSGGVTFTFSNTVLAAGARVVVAANRAAFQSRYGTGISVAGEYAGHLGTTGDRLILTGPLAEPILDFSFDGNWYPITAVAGFSLVIRDENAPLTTWGLRESWRPSGLLNGSPGQPDPLPSGFPQVLVNEALTHPLLPLIETVELFNASATSADISGWFLTDDPNVPMKFRIPDRTLLAPGGFSLFDEHDFNSAGGAGIPFGLGAAGGQVYLFSADANTNLSGYMHGFTFGAQRSGISFGRYVTSNGAEDFVAQTNTTLGAANAGPLVGPIVISEIMYHPPDALVGGSLYDDSDNEFIELRNITSLPVPLYDSFYPSNTWRLDQAVHYAFPQGATLPAGGALLVVSFDPTNDHARLAAFRSRYGLIPVAASIFGPYSGKLKNSDETIELKMPDTPDLNGVVAHVIVDKVHYDDQAPWPPAADGMGCSLQRVSLGGYANDPTNWVAAPPNPGAGYTPGAPPTILAQPLSQTVLASSNVTLSVTASGAGPLRYQWRFQGENILWATNASLILSNVLPANSGIYQAVVINSTGSTGSSNATLTVLTSIYLTAPSQNRSVRLATPTNTLPTNITFYASAGGGSPLLSYQWRFNGVNIPGATNCSYSLTSVSIANHGVFQVAISDPLGTTMSGAMNLSVLVAPFITFALPARTTAVQGDNVTWTVGVSGFPPPFTYSWRLGATVVTNVTLSSNFCTFTLFNAQPVSNLLCRVVVTNAAPPTNGIQANSTNLLTVLADIDGDHIPDAWEAQYGLNPNDPTDAGRDADGDGMTNLQEFLAGTNPTNALSVFRVDQISLGGGANLRFGAVAEKSYTVQYQDAMAGPSWLQLTNLPSRPTNWTAVISDPSTNRSRYYRLVTPQQGP